MSPSHPSLRLLCPRLAWLLGLMFLAGLAGCGPGGPPESPPVSQHSPSTHHDPITPAARPASLAAPARSAEPRVAPAWMAKDLDSPDVRVRLRALETWGQQAPTGAVDPLLLALEDEDERVQARALELIEQDWARGQAAKLEAEQ